MGHKTRIPLWLALTFLALPSARAEPPMTVDDAGVMERGGVKIEGAWLRDHKARGPDLVIGYSPIDGLEMAINAGLTHDHILAPSTRTRAYGLSAKWVPWLREVGWSAGLILSLGHARVNERATPHRHTERNLTLVGLASYFWEGGHKLHFNLGHERIRARGEEDDAALWGVGFEWSLTPVLQLTLEAFGGDTGRPERAVGLRYTLVESFKLNAAAGRGNGRDFGQIGFAWEF
ncbi:MAG: hypothetical protein RMN53_17290 [Anaerolineae bacterium]|nr:hypothetical protein [Anaerolineae bacterium]